MSGDTLPIPGPVRRWRWPVAAVIAAALALTACSEPSDEVGADGSDPGPVPIDSSVAAEVAGGTGSTASSLLEQSSPVDDASPGQLIWVHEVEPPDLQVDDPENGTDIASWIRQGLLEGLFGVDAALGFYPELLADEPEVTVNEDGTVVIAYRLRDGLRWSDGTPLTAADVAYTHEILVEGCETEADGSIVDGSDDGCEFPIRSRAGYELVSSFVIDGDRAFTVTFAAFYPAWRELYDQVFAAHAFGADAFTVDRNLRDWRSGPDVLPSSGPLVFGRWDRGRSLALDRNDEYHGSVSPDAENEGPAQVDGVLVAFVPDLDARIDLLLAGRAHLIMTDLDPAHARLAAADGFTVASRPGVVYDHWGFNLLNPHLAKPEVREAVAHALDKAELVDVLYRPLYGPILEPEGLGNAFWMPSQPGYQDHQVQYRGNGTEAAAERLTAAGYEREGDGVFAHPEDGRLRLRVGTPGGDDLRLRQLELAQEQLGRAGIELTIDVGDGLFLSRGPFAPESLEASATGGEAGDPGRWDIAQFAWSTGPWPGRVAGSYRSGSPINPYGYRNAVFDVAATDCDRLTEDIGRAACYRDLDRFLTALDDEGRGLVILPITQRPRFHGYATPVAAAGVAPDLAAGGPLVNIVDTRLG